MMLPITTPAVSIIIPIFNTAPWLRRCLDSVCAQTLKNIEIICIDDCSSDESADILREYAAHDPRILPLTLGRNQGAGGARNIGLDAASGGWLGFVDSDDAIAVDFYEKLYMAARECDAEIIKGTCSDVADAQSRINPEINLRIQEDKYAFKNSWWTAIYSTKFIRKHNIRFPLLIKGQDSVFLYDAVTHAKYINIVDDAVYYYYRREESNTTFALTPKRIDSYISASDAIIDILNKNTQLDENKYASEFLKIIQPYYLILEQKINNEDRDYAQNAVSHALVTFFKKCREPDSTLKKLNAFDCIFSRLIANADVEVLKTFLTTNFLQRLRGNARQRLLKTN